MKYLRLYEFNIKPMGKPEVDENTIRVESVDRGWYIDFYFDEKGKLIYTDNRWDIRMPDWNQFYVSLKSIEAWADYYDKKAIVYKVLERDANKYNL